MKLHSNVFNILLLLHVQVEESSLCSTLTTRRSQAGGDWFVTSYKPEEVKLTCEHAHNTFSDKMYYL